MPALADHLAAYHAYHRDGRNRLTHFIGVPMIIFSLLVAGGWWRFLHPELLPFALTGATLFVAAVTVHYARLDIPLALLQLPFSLALLYYSDLVAQAPFATSAAVCAGTFVGGWIFQLIGHAFEGRRPAIADNLLQAFNAPLFLLTEVLFGLGLRRELKASLAAQE